MISSSSSSSSSSCCCCCCISNSDSDSISTITITITINIDINININITILSPMRSASGSVGLGVQGSGVLGVQYAGPMYHDTGLPGSKPSLFTVIFVLNILSGVLGV